jgi:hypothetical protein
VRRDGAAAQAPEPEPATADGADLNGEELEDFEVDEEAATVPGGSRPSDPEARQRAVDAVRAERAERKKRARQRSRRKHGRRR